MDVLLADDPRPVWLQAWGGTNTIAQALWRLRQSRSPGQLHHALSKVRIYAISDQDSTIWWIRDQFPDIPLVLSYQFMAINYAPEGHPYSDSELFSQRWMTENVKEGHGPLAGAYPQTYFSEGDSPAVFHLVDTGLRSAHDPTWGGWGGRFAPAGPEHLNFYRDAADDGDTLKPLWRWLPALQNDFAARADWAVRSYRAANHAPRPRLAGPANRTVTGGSLVRLDASGSFDPDGDPLGYRWWHYPEPGSWSGSLAIDGADGRVASFTAPVVSEPHTIHVVLEVRDGGDPALTRYRRVVFTVEPQAPSPS